MKVAGLQTDLVWESPARNFEALAPWLAACEAAGAQLVVLPEMFACGFSMNVAAIAEPADGPSTAFLRQCAAKHGFWLAGSVPTKPYGEGEPPPAHAKARNELVLAGPNGECHRYAKIHPFTFAGEHEHYDAGASFVTVRVRGVRVTLFVCYDLRFADEFWQTAPETDCYIVVANWPKKRRAHWQTLLRARAIENQSYVVGVNRVGHGGGIEYSGDSAIYDPWGEPLSTASAQETMLLANIDPQVVADARLHFPVFDDRRRYPR